MFQNGGVIFPEYMRSSNRSKMDEPVSFTQIHILYVHFLVLHSNSKLIKVKLYTGVSKWVGTRYFYPPEIVHSTGRNY